MTKTSDSSKPHTVADALGLGSLADANDSCDPELLRELYRHARNEDGKRAFIEGCPTFSRGWINLDAERAKALVDSFVALDDADDLKHARRMAQSNLEAQPWNDLLGITMPPIYCRVKIHGSRWGLRFQSGEPAIRGREKINEELPAIPSNGPTGQTPETIPESKLPNPVRATAVTDSEPANDPAAVLRAGGLPI
jgi:hypothetical protein